MKHPSFILAWRYLYGARRTTIGTMLIICFISIYLSTTALALVTFIMEGFQQKTHATLKGLHADLIMQAHGHHINVAAIKKVIEQEFPEITGISPSDTQQALLSTTKDQTIIIALRAIDPTLESQTSALATMLCNTTASLQQALNKPFSALIGHKLAKQLKLQKGDTLELLTADTTMVCNNTLSFSPHTMHITELFETGIEELDNNVLVTSLKNLETLIPESGPSALHLNYSTATNEKLLIQKLKNVLAWLFTVGKNLYPALLEALKLEKYAMVIVLSLMVLIASMSIIALLFMLITAKRTDQAILLTMGFSYQACANVFIIIGLFVSITACITGLTTAFIIGLLLQSYPIIKLPDAYFVKELPIVIQSNVFVYILFFVVIVSLLSCLVAVYKHKNISLAALLRQP